MKVKLLLSTVFIAMLLITSCSKDDTVETETETEVIIETFAFSIAVDENQEEDTSLGSVSASINTEDSLSYILTSQSPSNALAINSLTGELTVNETAAFDYETNSTITAIVEVEGNSVSETLNVAITLNDKDDLEFLLSDSKADYVAASDGDWIQVTEEEYNDLALSLNDVSFLGTPNTEYDSYTSGLSGTHEFSSANYIGATIPAEDYVFAFKFYLSNGSDIQKISKAKSEVSVSIDASPVFKVKQSTNITSGYSVIGNDFPAMPAYTGTVYYILKGNSTNYNAESFLAFYKPSGFEMGFVSGTGYYYYAGGANTTSLGSNKFTGTLFYQGLSTSQKQW